jgi:hypothetical protein
MTPVISRLQLFHQVYDSTAIIIHVIPDSCRSSSQLLCRHYLLPDPAYFTIAVHGLQRDPRRRIISALDSSQRSEAGLFQSNTNTILAHM